MKIKTLYRFILFDLNNERNHFHKNTEKNNILFNSEKKLVFHRKLENI